MYVVWKTPGVEVCSGMGVSSGGIEMEVSVSIGGFMGGGDAVRKSPVGGVGRRVGMAGEGVRRWDPEIRW